MPFHILTKKEAAERVRVTERTLDNYIKAGVGPAVTRVGGSVRFRDDLLQAWLERCTVPPQHQVGA